MRLFVAIDLPHAIREKIAAVPLPRDRHWKWVDPENLHLTLKFIGEQESHEPVVRALEPVSGPAMEIGLKGLGTFPRVLWVGVQAPPELAQLALAIDEALIPLGIPPESRPFSPHLTLARVKEGRMPRLDEQPGFGAFTAREFVLYQSRLSSSGSRYTALHRFPLAESA